MSRHAGAWYDIGHQLGRMDDAYARAIRGDETAVPKEGDMLGNVMYMARNNLGMDRNRDVTDPKLFDLTQEGSVDRARLWKNSMMAGRYVLPAAGVTAAGAALINLTNAFGTAADQQSPGELGM